MPRGRFLDRDLSTNRQYWSMSADYRNFWDLLITWLDPFGRMDGDARIIKGIVCPLADWTADDIEQMLLQFEGLKRNNGLGWIERYQSNGIYCLWASGFKDHQKGLQITHEAKGKYDGYSNIPPPPKKLVDKAEIAPVLPAIDPPPITDSKLASMVEYYQNNLSMVTPTTYETMKLWCNEYDEADYQKAVDLAKKRKAKNPVMYIEACLKNGMDDTKPEENPEAEGDWKE